MFLRNQNVSFFRLKKWLTLEFQSRTAGEGSRISTVLYSVTSLDCWPRPCQARLVFIFLASQPRASISRLTFDIRQTSLFLAPVYVKWIFSCLVPRPLIKNLTLFSIWINQVFKAAQPALLYLVPFTLLPLFVMAYLKGDLKTMWHEPFAPPPASATTSKYQDIWRQPTI